jgi:HEAT repeat protein
VNLDAALRDIEHADPRVRAQAADALGRVVEVERPAARTALGRAVDDPHASVRYAALLSLGELGAHEDTDHVILRLDDGEPLVREAAAIALGELGMAAGGAGAREQVEAAFAALTEALSASHPEVRFQALASLIEIDAARAAPLVRPLLDDADGKVRAQAVAALGDARDATVRDRVARMLDDVDDVRFEAAVALARLGDRRGVPVLVATLAHRDRAFDAASALAEIGLGGDEQATETLAREVGRLFGDPMVKVRCAEALLRSGDARGRAYLEKARRARREDVRGLAESVLEQVT